MFKVGQKVVCTKEFERQENSSRTNFKWSASTDMPFPVKRKIYTIRRIWSDGYISLEEFDSYYSYDPCKFRPLDYSFAEEVEAMVNKGIVEIEEENLVAV